MEDFSADGLRTVTPDCLPWIAVAIGGGLGRVGQGDPHTKSSDPEDRLDVFLFAQVTPARERDFVRSPNGLGNNPRTTHLGGNPGTQAREMSRLPSNI